MNWLRFVADEIYFPVYHRTGRLGYESWGDVLERLGPFGLYVIGQRWMQEVNR